MLVAVDGGALRPPEAMPLSRAALGLRDAGIEVVFGASAAGGVLTGLAPTRAGWIRREVAITAAYDRFPDQARPQEHAGLLAGLPGVPIANPPAVMRLCRDKWATQLALEAAGVATPPAERDPGQFAARLAAWGTAYVKPRHGAFGVGVRRVVAGEAVPARVEGLAGEDDAILQRAVPPPGDFVSVRALVQREGDGWVVAPLVARIAKDPVVNVRRGAEAVAADRVFSAAIVGRMQGVALAAVGAVADARTVELGVDLVVDPDGGVWVIEVNGRPYGRLGVLAALESRFAEEGEKAAARVLWAVVGVGR